LGRNVSERSEIVCRPLFERREYPRVDDSFAFVIMPFGDELLEDIYRQYVKPSVEAVGLGCIRGDDIFGTESIMEDVWESICRCSVVIGEFTGRNPNVLYEAGVTHTIGKPLVGITQSMDDIPFDFRHIRVLSYANSPSGYRSLAEKLALTLRGLRLGGGKITPSPIPEPDIQVSQLETSIHQQHAQTERLYLTIEQRHIEQTLYYHRRLAESGITASERPLKLEMCPVPATTVAVDQWNTETGMVVEGPRVSVESFSMARYPATNSEYLQFTEETGHVPPEHWQGDRMPDSIAEHPVIGVSWADVQLFCEWATHKIGASVRLPTEAEWLTAAGYGLHRQRYPWGPTWESNACTSGDNGRLDRTPVTAHDGVGTSPFGCEDMLGNVWEWTDTFYSDRMGVPWRAVRGGAGYTALREPGSTARLAAFPGHFLFVSDLGFRVVIDDNSPGDEPNGRADT
jgi:formylglycine-generating enzyme required for sulfatase activity